MDPEFVKQSPVPSCEAVQRVNDGEKVVLVRNKTSADDIHGLHAAEGHRGSHP